MANTTTTTAAAAVTAATVPVVPAVRAQLAGHPAAVAAVRQALAGLKDPARPRPRRPGWRARLRRPAPAELVVVTLTGRTAAVTALARALARVVVVVGIRDHPRDYPRAPLPAHTRQVLTCYPPHRINPEGPPR